MALAYLLDPSFQTLDENGRPLVGGHIEVYRHNTSVKYVTKADFEGTDNPFKVPLNSKGMAVIIASDQLAYDVFCYDRFGALYWSRQNVNTIGGGGEDITKSVLIAKANYVEGDDSTPTKTFQYIEMSRVGDDVKVDENNDIRLNKGVYHVSLVVHINVNPTEESRPWIEEVTLNLPSGYGYVSTLLDRSIRPPHSSSSPLVASFDYVVDTDSTKFNIHLAGLGNNCYATLEPISIHKIAEVE